MKTKLFVLLAAMSSLMAMTTQAEIRTVVVDGDNKEATIEIKEGEVAKCVFAKLIYPSSGYEWRRNGRIEIIKDGITIEVKTTKQGTSQMPNPSNYFPVVSGPAKIILFHEEQSSILSMEITPNETALSKSVGYALVLPEGEDGKQKLVLESSTDLVNWTEDSLGSKDSSDNKRFYRLRAVKE